MDVKAKNIVDILSFSNFGNHETGEIRRNSYFLLLGHPSNYIIFKINFIENIFIFLPFIMVSITILHLECLIFPCVYRIYYTLFKTEPDERKKRKEKVNLSCDQGDKRRYSIKQLNHVMHKRNVQ